ncbi:MAG: DNA-3-methyladenine glycosylase [Flavobacteriales bacterium]|nr:DNA-3-methyladenine glycosylase [Flavobacteriales bacterium]MCB9168019.1 DNA-3-methyladenine glycosylase [Flavobacteriales bacterium]
MKLDRSYYERDDVVGIARDLLGKVLHSSLGGMHTSGIITETEAYAGTMDRASHAFGGRRTPRTEVMFGRGGTAYVYLCYGIHHLFNVVTNVAGVPHAVLVRGIAPMEGTEVMRQLRGPARPLTTNGPGTCAQALGISTKHTGCDLTADVIWISDERIHVPDDAVRIGPRIGVEYAGSDAKRPYRFLLTDKRVLRG